MNTKLVSENQRLAKFFRQAFLENDRKWRDRTLSDFVRGQHGGMAVAYRRAHEEIVFALQINSIMEKNEKNSRTILANPASRQPHQARQ